MPNWCSNVLIVEGPPDEVDAFVRKSEEQVFIDWENTYRDMIARARETRSILEKLKLYVLASRHKQENSSIGMFAAHYPPPDFVVTLGHSDFGYEWCFAEWGTEWDVESIVTYDKGSSNARFCFKSAWAPPIKWLEVVSQKWPHLRFTMGYYEPGMGSYGYTVFENGICTDGDSNETELHHDCLDEWLDKPIRNSEDFISLYQKTAATVQRRPVRSGTMV